MRQARHRRLKALCKICQLTPSALFPPREMVQNIQANNESVKGKPINMAFCWGGASAQGSQFSGLREPLLLEGDLERVSLGNLLNAATERQRRLNVVLTCNGGRM